MLKPPSEKDVSEDKKLSPAQTVRALYSAQWRFYKFGYDTMLKISLFQLALNILLGAAVFFLVAQGNPEPKLIAVNDKGQITHLQPMTVKRYSEPQVRQFVVDAIQATFNFHYADYTMRLENASEFFTDTGYKSFSAALHASGLIKQIQDKRLLMHTVTLSTPVIDPKESGYFNGHTWVVYVDTLRTLHNTLEKSESKYRHKILIRQVPLDYRARGMAIISIKDVRE